MTDSARRRMLGERIARHGLTTRPVASPAAAARLTTAIQAQDAPASRLGIRARANGVTDAEVRQATDVERVIVRTWLMRGTIHLVDAQDLRWLTRLIGPALIRKFRTRWTQLGFTEELFRSCVAALVEILADAQRTRAEIRDSLAERGVELPSSDPPAVYHLLVHATALGLVCRGPDRGRNNTFVLVDDWLPGVPPGPTGDDALAELARRYFAAYSPATAADFTTWSGLASARAIDLIRDELEPVDVDGRAGFRLGSVEPGRGVRLLPAFDNFLIGYRDRAAILDRELQDRVYQGGWILPTVLRDGQVVGTWALDRAKGRVNIASFGELEPRVRRAVEAEVADIGRFLDRDLAAGFSPAG